jgi:hypothetical protein
MVNFHSIYPTGFYISGISDCIITVQYKINIQCVKFGYNNKLSIKYDMINILLKKWDLYEKAFQDRNMSDEGSG